MTDRHSPCAQVINNADLLAHISGFMHFSSDPEQSGEPGGGYRLALLPSRTMLPSSRAKTMGVISEWRLMDMREYLSSRTAYIQRQRHERPAGSAMPIDLPLVAAHLNAWLDHRSDETKRQESRATLRRLAEILTLVEALQREHTGWDAAAAPLFTSARDRIVDVMHAVRLNIQARSLRWEKDDFDALSQMLLEIIEARLTAPADDYPHAKEGEQLRAGRAKIESWRKIAAEQYHADARKTNYERLTFYERFNGRLKSAKAWFNEKCDGTGMPFGQFFDD